MKRYLATAMSGSARPCVDSSMLLYVRRACSSIVNVRGGTRPRMPRRSCSRGVNPVPYRGTKKERKRERERVCVCVCEREIMCVCVCMSINNGELFF